MLSRRKFIRDSSLAGLAIGTNAGGWFRSQEKNFVYSSPYIKLELASTGPDLLFFSTDSLGKGLLSNSPLLKEAERAHPVHYNSKINGNAISYYSAAGNKKTADWEIRCEQTAFSLHSASKAGSIVAPFTISFSQRLNHCTVLGARAGEQQVQVPCLLH